MFYRKGFLRMYYSTDPSVLPTSFHSTLPTISREVCILRYWQMGRCINPGYQRPEREPLDGASLQHVPSALDTPGLQAELRLSKAVLPHHITDILTPLFQTDRTKLLKDLGTFAVYLNVLLCF